MSHPILYAPAETAFEHNGIGILSDCVSCLVTEESNGAFELEMQYPMDGIHYADIVDRCIIKAKPNQEANTQLFRVYSISKPMSGIVSVYAEHISYDLSGIPVSAFTAENASSAMTGLLTNAAIDCPFTFRTDKATSAKFAVTVPGSIRSQLGGKEGSILDVYGGEYEFDNFDVILHNSRGRNRGVSIRYGKNLTDIKQDRNCSNVATGVYPYWVNSESGEVVELPEKIVNADGTYGFVKIKMLDVSSNFEEKPTEEQIRTYTQSYIKANNIGVPSVSLSVSFKQLEQSEEYKGMALLEKVSLFDTVNVEFPALGVSATAKAVQIAYNTLLDRVESITLGSVKAKITDTVASQQQQIAQTPTRTEVQRASAAATAWLTNGKGYKVERRDANGNTIDTLYMDTPDIETAVNVLRIGQSGIGFSQSGVDGPYYSAWTLDGVFDASWIKTGVLSSWNEKLSIDLSGENAIKMDGGIETQRISVRPEGYSSYILDIFASEETYNDKTIPYAGLRMRDSENNDIFTVNHDFVVDEGGGNFRLADTYVACNHGGNTARFVCGEGASDLTLASSSGCYFGIRAVGEDIVWLYLPSGIKKISWKDNGDGTYTLIGQ